MMEQSVKFSNSLLTDSNGNLQESSNICTEFEISRQDVKIRLTADSVGLGADPVQIVFSPGEPGGVADLTPGGGSEGDHSDLLPLIAGALHAGLHVERTAGVSVAGSLATGGVDADNPGTDDAVDVVAVAVGDDGPVLNHPQDGGDSSGAVAGLAPAGAGHHLAHIGGVAGHGHTAGLDVVVEGHRAGQLNQGDVVGEGIVVPPGVGPAVVGGDLHPVGLAGGSHVVGSGHDVEVGGAVSTVSGSHDVVLGDEGAATEPGVVNEESHLPGPLVLLSLETSDNPVLGGRALNTALSGEVDSAGLVGGLAQLAGPDGPGLDKGVSGRELAEVPGGGRPPVLLRPQAATVGQSQGGATEENCQENFHPEIQSL